MYYILLGMSLGFGFITKFKYGKKIYCFTMFLVLALVSGLRNGVGYDFNPYIGIFYKSYLTQLETLMSGSLEKGYIFINETISNFTLDYQWLFIVVAIIVAAAVMWFIYRYSKNVWLSVFAFLAFGCFYFSMDFMRQIFAGIIMMYAFKRLDENDYFYYVLLVLFASCFHKSALLMLPLLLILKIPLNKITFGIYTALTFIALVFSEFFIQLVLNKGYYTSYVLDNVHMTTGIPIIYGIVVGAIFVLAFIYRKDLIKMRSMNRILLVVAFLNAAFTIIGAKHSIISRFTVLLEIPVIVILLVDLILVMMKKIKNPNLKISILLGFLLISMGYHFYLEMNNYNGVFPYEMVDLGYKYEVK